MKAGEDTPPRLFFVGASQVWAGFVALSGFSEQGDFVDLVAPTSSKRCGGDYPSGRGPGAPPQRSSSRLSWPAIPTPARWGRPRLLARACWTW